MFAHFSLALPLLALGGIAEAFHTPAGIAALRTHVLEKRNPRQVLVENDAARTKTGTYPPPNPPLLTFKSAQAKKFYVDGTKIPDVDFDVGPSYAGLLPIADNSPDHYFFWFYPTVNKRGVDHLTFWTNGGPGCSSMESAFQETGPISWLPGQARPTQNPWSWTNHSSILYVEQPVGTGYSTGKPSARNETDVAAAAFGFFQQFLKVFPEMKNKNFWLTGESYAGYYVPYIADYIYKHQSKLALPLKGVAFFDPSLTYSVIQEQIPTYPLVKRYEHSFALNSSTMALLEELHESCGYADYLKKYTATPPPPAPFPIPAAGTFDQGSDSNLTCDTFDLAYNAALVVSQGAFNIYHVVDTFPTLWSVLGFPYSPQLYPGETGDPVYFNRTEVKKALHAPLDADWAICSDFKSKPISVFPHGDKSVPSALSVLPGVIEKSERAIIGHGLADMVLISEGTRIAIQNMTWNGNQGFRTPIKTPLIVQGQGSLGQWHTERGFTYVEVDLSGHQIPQYQPQAALQIFQFLLGQRKSPSV